MRFFNIDVHVSVIKDIETIFRSFGHKIDSLSLSSHSWVFGEEAKRPEIITSDNWKMIDDDMVDRFYDFYKGKLDDYDGFVVTYPPVFSKLYERFNKPIIVVCATRYEFPYTNDVDKWKDFNAYLENNKNIILVSNNLFDKKYTELFVNREVKLIESLCSYTNFNYAPTKKESVLYSKVHTPPVEGLVNKSMLGRVSWQELFSYRSIVHMPYNASTMSIFEQYYANVPIIFPSIDLASKLLRQNVPIFSEISFRQILSLRPDSLFNNKKDINDYKNIDNVIEWIKLSDFYRFPHITYFDSFEELKYRINEDYSFLSLEMKDYNLSRQSQIYQDWREILDGLKS